MSFLQLKNVSYTYPNGFEAVKNLNLEFDLGESVAIIGQNGAGKTTAVKLMNGLLKPTKGEVLVEGNVTARMTTAQTSRLVGYVFQNPDEQIFQETIYKEIAYGLVSKKLPTQTIQEKVKKAAALCGLSEVLQEHPYNLPYSKRKFVTIAAVIVMDTPVIILDEPTAGQDRESTELLADIITYLSKENKTVITITHDMEFVAQQFKRVIVLTDKEKQQDASPEIIFWDFPLLKKANLKQPYICQLADRLGFKDIITINELIERVF
ncbi:energy-coupling factor ABC transporter ATP-binding protein [Vagococcus acidifermentans]|uniref:ABC transporter ATP-binding protein n=1 Tax=Vagococcus acidifermentans TaxID=564710 RepID=A0A430AX04_9ENTE|nr:ABC transporter ATP-binding protein [Vagococcus acidifermentans]RSU12575.1 ABC transporter ATP-binding protein [Vagococcus acidifermentans]